MFVQKVNYKIIQTGGVCKKDFREGAETKLEIGLKLLCERNFLLEIKAKNALHIVNPLWCGAYYYTVIGLLIV